MLPMVPGVPLRRTTECKRNGISNLYATLDERILTRSSPR